ncbi:MAG: tetratricopeptide repeat protein [bacterium]|nr:tetratricopeptide repeat protein [bacterium]
MGIRRVILVFILFLFANICFASSELSQQATAFYSDNNFDKTMELILQIPPNDRSAQDWLILGNLLDEKGEKEQALFKNQKALRVNSKYNKTYYNMSNIYMTQGRYLLAIDSYKNATKINQKNPYLYYNLACAYLKKGKTKEAKTALLKAVTLKNNIPEIHYNLAFVYQKLGNTKLAQTYLDNYNKLTATY